MLTMLPPRRRAIMRRPASWLQRKVPSMITRTTRCQSSSLSSSGRARWPSATLLTRMSTWPSSQSSSSKVARICAGSPMSALVQTQRRPSASTSRAVSAAPASSRSQISRSAPCSASASAAACPLPPLAPPPVTTATRLVRSNQLFTRRSRSAASSIASADRSRGPSLNLQRSTFNRERREHDLPRVPVQGQLDRLLRPRERQGVADQRLEVEPPEPAQRPVDAPGHALGAPDRQLLEEQLLRLERGRVVAVGDAGDQDRPARRGQPDRLLDRARLPDRLEDHVGAEAARRLGDDRADVLGRRIDRQVGAEAAPELAP